ncbi:MAG: SPOR domain-containing protein [Candidatus Zixiibacteriota bacterium]|nr:MAG: SPOR domain-containing protein [candidate division Zixibacteria bacterium]
MGNPNPEGRRPGLPALALALALAAAGPSPLPAQTNAEKPFRGLEAYDRGDLDQVRTLLAGNTLDPAEAEYLHAALVTSGDEAMEMYRQVVLKYPESPLSSRAMDRVRQYHYALGLYAKAEELAGTLPHYRPPEKKLSPPGTAPAALVPASARTAEPVAAPAVRTAPATGYSLQVGAFSLEANARKLASSLEAAGFTVQVLDAAHMHNRLHMVRVTGFDTEQDARTAAAELQRRFQLQPLLVPDNP